MSPRDRREFGAASWRPPAIKSAIPTRGSTLARWPGDLRTRARPWSKPASPPARSCCGRPARRGHADYPATIRDHSCRAGGYSENCRRQQISAPRRQTRRGSPTPHASDSAKRLDPRQGAGEALARRWTTAGFVNPPFAAMCDCPSAARRARARREGRARIRESHIRRCTSRQFRRGWAKSRCSNTNRASMNSPAANEATSNQFRAMVRSVVMEVTLPPQQLHRPGSRLGTIATAIRPPCVMAVLRVLGGGTILENN